jgi:ATP-dependent helicase/nuclease subunit A
MNTGQTTIASLSSEIEQTRSAIRASAGSGKTFTLTNYYLRSLLSGSLPQNLLATTFTRNAASEIFGRVLLRLSDACENDEKFAVLNNDLKLNLTRQQGVENLLGLCRALHQVRISTIDAFFGQMLRGYSHDIGLPTSMQLVNEDSPEAQALQYEAIRTMLEGSEREQFLQLLDGLESGRAKRTVTESLLSQFNSAHELFQSSPPQAWESVASTKRVLDAGELKVTIQALEAESQNWIGASGYIKQPLILKDIDKVRQSDWQKFLETGLGAKVATGENYYKKPVPEELARAYQPLVEHAQGVLLQQHLSRTKALYHALAEYDRHYTQLRLRAGMLFFRDVPRLLADLLPQFTAAEIEHRLDARVTHLLLDEFQDTTPQQYAILKPFAERIANMPDEQGLFFCVGDLKQSIYGWRGATPEIFNRLQIEFPVVHWRDSNRSFRSSPVILQAVNQLFSGLPRNPIVQDKCPAAVEVWKEYFQPHEAVRETLSGYVELLQSPEKEEIDVQQAGDNNNEVLSKGSAHLDFAAGYVERIVQQAPGATVGVLMRSNSKAREMLHLLQKRGVRATGEMGVNIAADPAVALVLSVLQFSRHPADTAAKFHLLHSPLAGMLYLRGETVLPDGEASRRIRDQLALNGFGATIHSWAKVLAPYGDAESALRLVQLMELADNFRGDDTAQFMDTVARHDAPQSVPAQVQVMTVHKSKGLEFDAVVLPELHGLLEKSENFLLSRDPQTQHIRKICVWPNQFLRDSQPVLEEMYQEHFTTRMNEAFCTLYVAMTRAKHALYMIVPPLSLDSKGNAKKSPFSYASILRAGFGGDEALTQADFLNEPIKTGDELWHQHLFRKADDTQPAHETTPPFSFDASLAAVRHLKMVTPSSHRHGSRRGVLQLLQSNSSSDAKERGLQLHSLLEQVEWFEYGDEIRYDNDFLALQENRECFVKPVLQPGQQAKVWRERRFSVIVDDTFIQGTFDRVVMILEGNQVLRVIIYDFKTGSNDTPLLDDYIRQMEEYRKALSHMLKLEPALITCQLQFIDSGKSVVI